MLCRFFSLWFLTMASSARERVLIHIYIKSKIIRFDDEDWISAMVCLVYIVHQLCDSVRVLQSGLKAANETLGVKVLTNKMQAGCAFNDPWLGKIQSAQLPDSIPHQL